MAGVSVAQATGRAAQQQTSGMLLEEAFAHSGFWVGQSRTPPGSVGGWHHHGDHHTFTYLASGQARYEWGKDGEQGADLKPGDFIHISPHTIHREMNTGSVPNLLVIFRSGSGPTLVSTGSPER
jgi:uncharacterized RmlC-like cupin family protein